MNRVMKWCCLLLLCIMAVGMPLQGQDIICPSTDCGNLNVNFNNAGEVVFCEGSTITLFNESASGFDYFVIDWGDGAVDTLFDYSDAQHTYDIPDSLVCQTPQQSMTVSFRGVAICGDKNSCQEGSYGFGIKPEPFSAFSVGEAVCVTSPFTPGDNSCHADTYLWDFGDGNTSTDPNPSHLYSSPGTYQVTQTVTNSCGSDMSTRMVTVVGEPEADFTQSDDGGCANTVIDFVDQSNEFSNTTWSITPTGEANWSFTDTLMTLGSKEISVLFKQPQAYTVTLTARNVCGVDDVTTELIFEEAPEVSISTPPPACDALSLTAADLGFQVTGSFTQVLWEFENGTPASATGTDFGTVNFTQNGKINLTVEGSCGNLDRSLDVTVNQSSTINITSPAAYCTGSSPDTLVVSPAGGTWSGTGVSADGVFDPAVGSGTYTLTYRLNNAPCNDEATVTVEVRESESVVVQDAVFCMDSPPAILSFSPAGGSWSGEGITAADTGRFDPAASGVGIFSPVYTYVDPNGCAVTGSPVITVEAVPQISVPDTLQLCLTNMDINLLAVSNTTADPGGGNFSWSGPGITDPNGTFNAADANLAAGVYEINILYERNACRVNELMIIELTDPEPLVIDEPEPVCIAENELQLAANLTGTWSGPGIDPNTGRIDLNDAGGGIHTYTLRYAEGTSCAQEGSIQVEVIDLGAVVTAGAPESACAGPPTHTLNGASPADGRWSGTGIVNEVQGVIDLSQLTPGQSYDYEYCVESPQVTGCSACSTKTFTYNPKPAAGFTFEGTPCINETFSLLPDSPGLLYDWDFGDGDSSTDENPIHAYISPGDKTLVQIIRTTEGCADTISQDLYVTSPPVAAFDLLDTEGCAPFNLNVVDNSSGDDITRQWCINGDTLPGPGAPSYVFDSLAQTTDFPILLKVSNLCGTRLDSATVRVRPYPLVNFGFSEDEGCSPFSPDLINITLGEPEDYFWSVAPGFTSDEFEPELPVFTTPDDSVSVYTVRLIAENACGTDTLQRELTVYPPDVEAFIGLDTLSGCQPFTVRPQSFSTPGSILSWEVIGPDGQVSGAVGGRPDLLLPNAGVYTMILYASRCGTDSDTAQVEVLPAPELLIDHLPQVCLGETIVFENQSENIGDSQWDFGDGSTGTAFSPEHRYDSMGVYTVTYTAQSLINNCPSTISSSVAVLGLPASAFTPSILSGCPPLNVDFMNTSSGVGNLEYTWDFGDGSNRSFTANPSHEFTTPGVFEVKLITRDEASCFSDTAVAVITVFDEPVSAFTLSAEALCLGNDTLRVADESIDAVSRSWLIGGTPFAGPDPVLVPQAVGNYTAQLIVANDFGCSDTSMQVYSVLPSPQSALTAEPEALCAGGMVNFNNQSVAADEFVWDLGDGTGSTLAAPVHQYPQSGDYRVSLIARNDNGCPPDTAFTDILIHPNPVAAFTTTQSFECGAPSEVFFTNNSVGNLSNEWTFGDGKEAMNLSPVHTYDFSGRYTARLITISDFGCRDTSTQIVDIYGDPIAIAGISAVRICAGMPVTLTAEPTQALRYEWYLDNSLQADTGRVVTYRPETVGKHDIQLIAIYNDICRDTLQIDDAFEVFAQPQAAFEYVADESEQQRGDVRFINLSTNAESYSWDLGDGTITAEFEPEHEYDINRDIIVQLIAINRNGGAFVCRDTAQELVQPEWITSFEVPNAVSPDFGEPAIRVFGAVGTGVAVYSLRVYSPYGELIWSTTALEEGQPSGRWMGLDQQGNPVPQGAYSWEAQVEFVSGERIRKRGTVTVLR